MPRVLTYLTLGSMVISPLVFPSDNPCSKALQQIFFGTPVTVNEISVRANGENRPNGGQTILRHIFSDPNTVVVGFEVPRDALNSAEPIGHTFVATQHLRYDGRGITSLSSRITGGGSINRGYFIKLDLPPDIAERLTQYGLSRKKKLSFSLSCFHDIVDLLRDGAGIYVRDADGRTPWTARGLLQAMIEGGFYDAQGNRVPIQIYTTQSDTTLEQMYQAVRANEIGQTSIISGALGFAAFLALRGIWNLASAFLDDEGDLPEPQPNTGEQR